MFGQPGHARGPADRERIAASDTDFGADRYCDRDSDCDRDADADPDCNAAGIDRGHHFQPDERGLGGSRFGV